jgi:hypothetical protein
MAWVRPCPACIGAWMNKPKLRVGLLLDDNVLMSAWQFKMVENIQQSNFAQVELVVVNARTSNRVKKNLMQKIRANFGNLTSTAIEITLDKLYYLLIERSFSVPDASKKLNASKLLADIPVLECKPVQTQWSDRFDSADISQIEGHQLDILVRCGFRILRGDILTVARYGVWSFHHGDNQINRGGPAGFWESMQSWPVNGSILQVLNEDLDNGLVLYRSFSSTSDMSVRDNRSRNKWKTLSFMTRKMRQLYELGPDEFFRRAQFDNRHPTMYSERLFVKPTNYEMAKLLLRKVQEKAVKLYRNNFYINQWILMYDIKDSFSSALWRYKKIIPPKDRFYADPHIIHRDDKYYIFIEEFIYGTDRGFISVIEMDEKGNYGSPQAVLERPYHLSYPFVFEHDNCYYMIPETQSNRTVELYKCTEFPHRWEFEMNLMENIRAGDATLYFADNRWWMFANISETKGASLADELCIFSSTELLSQDWQPHPANPVVSDCRNARPAGRVFKHGNQLYRPAQNSSFRYGYGFNLNEITRLTEDEYAEITVSRIEPHWDKKITGTHTFNKVDALHMIDASYHRSRFRRS